MQSDRSLRERYLEVKDRIDAAARRSGRTGDRVVLVAVTKYASIEQIRELIGLGQVDFGENRVQQLVQRAAQIEEYLGRKHELGGAERRNLPDRVRWHMIGTLQRNKVKKAIEVCRLIHSVESLRLAEDINAAAVRREQPMEVLLQVNIAQERSKHGITGPAVRHLIDQMETMVNLQVRGLMCMAPIAEDPETVRPVFERCRELFEDLRREGVGGARFDVLSMGMSNDFEVAIECGANVVRVGSAIFGTATPESDANAG